MSLTKATYSLINGAPTNVLDYGAVGNGTTDDTTALQNWLNVGGALYLPEGKTFAASATLIASVANTTIFGTGKIITKGAPMDGLPLLRVTADDVTIDSVRFAHPSYTCIKTGVNTVNYGVRIEADRCTVTRCRFDGFLHPVAVYWMNAAGTREVYDWEISYNWALNCIGAGDGPADPVSLLGEDRGDAFVNWGARGKMLFNLAIPKNGEDCRIAFHIEALQDRPSTGTTYDDRYCIVQGNMTFPSPDGTGRYRRGVIDETVNRSLLIDNIVVGPTWWGVGAVQGTAYEGTTLQDVGIRGNIVVWNIPASDQTGAAWSPIRTCYQIAGYGNSGIDGSIENVNVTDNIAVTEAPAAYGFVFLGAVGASAVNRRLYGNNNNAVARVSMGNYDAFAMYGCDEVDLQNCRALGAWRRGLDTFNTVRVLFRNGVVDGATAARSILVNTASGETDLSGTNIGSAGGAELANVVNVKVAGMKFGNITGDELTIFNGENFELVGMTCAQGNGTWSLGGTLKNYAIGHNNGFTMTSSLPGATLLSDKTSWLNTWGKYEGKEIIFGTAPAQLYVAQGSTDVSAWRKVEDGTQVVPS
jgi:hypothetical protein